MKVVADVIGGNGTVQYTCQPTEGQQRLHSSRPFCLFNAFIDHHECLQHRLDLRFVLLSIETRSYGCHCRSSGVIYPLLPNGVTWLKWAPLLLHIALLYPANFHHKAPGAVVEAVAAAAEEQPIVIVKLHSMGVFPIVTTSIAVSSLYLQQNLMVVVCSVAVRYVWKQQQRKGR